MDELISKISEANAYARDVRALEIFRKETYGADKVALSFGDTYAHGFPTGKITVPCDLARVWTERELADAKKRLRPALIALREAVVAEIESL